MIKQAYAGEAFSRSRAFEWYKRFLEGRDSVPDDSRASRPSIAHTNANVERVRQLLQEDRRVTVDMISEERNLNLYVCHKILREDLWVFNARIIPHSLTDEQEEMEILFYISLEKERDQ
ncbi:protein GVQW3-like [Stegodyphus dumicola]|uniref:protein GVQW3-like n=1 Tax=Stegodyphus dumicola TaxID=202533 RepID=UPI0015AA6703|nr:protein GVQW3-like [Stegodyphus dumicola]